MAPATYCLPFPSPQPRRPYRKSTPALSRLELGFGLDFGLGLGLVASG